MGPLRQACEEESFGLRAAAGLTDEQACNTVGGTTPRIAVIAGITLAEARRRLYALEHAGRVVRGRRLHSGVIRWWPVGLAEEAAKAE